MQDHLGLRRRANLLTVLAVVTATIVLGACDWPTWRGGPGRTGSSGETVLGVSNVGRLRLRWSKPPQSGRFYSDLVAASGLLYLRDEYGSLTALDATTGAIRWTVSDDMVGPPTVADGVLYVGTGSHTLVALDAATGARRWSVPFTSIGSSPLVANGMVYVPGIVGSEYGFLAFSAVDGSARWALPGSLSSAASYADGLVYISGSDGILRALDAATGVERWRATGGSFTMPPAVSGGLVFVGDTLLRAFDAQTGAPRWAVAAGSNPNLAVSNGIVYFASTQLHALDASTGQELWHGSTEVTPGSVPTLANGVLFLADLDHPISAFDASNGVLLWSGPGSEPGTRFEPVLSDGSLFVISPDQLDAFGIPPVSAALAITPTDAMDFAMVSDRAVATAKTITVRNYGSALTGALATTVTGASPQFQRSADTCTGVKLAAGASCSINVAFAPTGAGAQSARIAVSDADQTVGTDLTGFGFPFTISPPTLDFGSAFYAQPSAPHTFTVTNVSSTSAAPIVDSTHLGANFTLTGTTCGDSLAAGASCTAVVRFVAADQYSGSSENLEVAFAGAQNREVLGAGADFATLTGTVRPWLTIAGSGDFGPVALGTTKSTTFSITNDGPTTTGPITTSLIAAFTGQEAWITSDTCNGATLAHGAPCAVVVAFTPTGTAPSLAGLSFVASNTGSSVVVITGSGV
jgi:outer membrane protein assembly factor BamB